MYFPALGQIQSYWGVSFTTVLQAEKHCFTKILLMPEMSAAISTDYRNTNFCIKTLAMLGLSTTLYISVTIYRRLSHVWLEQCNCAWLFVKIFDAAKRVSKVEIGKHSTYF